MKIPLKMVGYACCLFLVVSTNCLASNVKVYSEGGYEGNTFLIKIFTDIEADATQGPLVSAGVRINYPADKLSKPVVVENNKEWSFGSQITPHYYLDAASDKLGVVKVLLGKRNLSSPLAGVQGKRVLVASVAFTRKPSTDVPTPQEFGVACANEAPFADFVTTQGVQLDDLVSFEPMQITSMNALRLRDTMRILRVSGGLESSLPIRPSELDVNADDKIDLTEAFERLKSTSK